MIDLYQVPWSPFCLVQSRILSFSGAPHKLVNVPATDRREVWRVSRQRYYQVPLLKDGRNVVFETGENSQVIAKYLETKLQLGLFPAEWDGLQRILWANIENEIEGVTFRLNDVYYREFVPKAEQLNYLRFKERKFGRGCLEQWAQNQKQLQADLSDRLLSFEQMLKTKPYLLEGRPRFVDFDLWGMLANFLFSGHYKFPAVHPRLKSWYERMSNIENSDIKK
jgi:glutathione S-transferase